MKHIGNLILFCTPCWILDCAMANDTNQCHFPAFLTEAMLMTPGGTGHDHYPKPSKLD